jgi:deoxyribodipyrimidine photo-lyase
VTPLDHFPPTRAAALARIAALRPADYARSRNAIEGAVTRLSPYIVHGLVGLPEVLAGVAARHRLGLQHKFVFELGWREYFRHVWRHRGDGILHSLHAGALPEAAYAAELPADIRQARTGVPVVDQAVRTLYASGHLHNHARMWLASYVVHLRKVHWRAGADWLVAHLLDGDLASNHLSWQWVAGTGSHKPYLFNADNVARYAPAAWHSPGSVIDTSYDRLDAIARSAQPLPATPVGDGVDEPALGSKPPGLAAVAARPADVAGRDVWLLHPWALGEPPADLPAGSLCLGWWPAEHHAAWPWSAARWAFVGQRMSALAPRCWHAGGRELAQALAAARSVQTLADPHVGALLPPQVQQRAPAHLFAEPDRACASFSSWWTRSIGGLQRLADLPGLQALCRHGAAGPLFEDSLAAPSRSRQPDTP